MINTPSYFSYVKKRFKLKNFINYFVISFFIILFGSLSAMGALNRSTTILLEQIGYSIIAAVSLSLVIGFLGELSLGHAGFMSIGAYVGGFFEEYILTDLTASSPLLSILIAIVIGGVAAAIFGFIIGLPALRLKGDYLAIVTLAFGEIIKVIIQNTDALGGSIGLDVYRYNKNTLFIIIFVMVLITLIIIQNFIRSKHGRAVMAIRDNEIAARAMGVNVTYYKLLVFVMSAFFAGIAGVLFANTQNKILSTTFSYTYSIDILVIVVLGGMGNINGSIISAVLITFINSKLATILTGDLASLQKLFYSLILVVIVIYNNAPKLKNFREKMNRKWKENFVDKLFKKKEKPPADDKEYNADWSRITTKIEMNEILSTTIVKDDKPQDDEGGTPNA